MNALDSLLYRVRYAPMRKYFGVHCGSDEAVYVYLLRVFRVLVACSRALAGTNAQREDPESWPSLS